MLSFSKIKNSDLTKILGIRSEGNKVDESLMGGGPSFSFPHETFTLGLSSLIDSELPIPERSGTRVIEIADDSFKFIYEVYRDAGPQMFRDKNFVGDYEKAFANIADLDSLNGNYAVRTLRVPALNVDALWLHNNMNEDDDKFIPVRSVTHLETSRVYSRSDFFNLLRTAAKQFDSNANSELLGA